MTWWFNNPTRLRQEIDDIAALTNGSETIRILGWRPLKDDWNIAVDVEVLAGAEWVPLTLFYPALFPATAPSLQSMEGRRLSDHQYAGGELCLEYRPDNWETHFTGAMMLQSAIRLLAGEAIPDAPPLPSAHFSSLGQRSRAELCRFILTPEVKLQLAAVGVGTTLPLEMSEHVLKDSRNYQILARIHTIGNPPSQWKDTTTVQGLSEPGLLLRLADGASLPSAATFGELEAFLAASGNATINARLTATEKSMSFVVANGATAKAWSTYARDDGTRACIEHALVEIPVGAARLPASYDVLPGKKVGLVGCGSLGTKIAVSLVRSGVGVLVLVDDDLVLPGNLVRQEYTVEALGGHKVDALTSRLKRIKPNVNVRVRAVLLGGQEAASTTTSVLEDLGQCDLIIDASADATAFNLCSSIATHRKIPMVWGEVLAGGIGGFVARARPEQDPAPQLVRRHLAAWCETQAVRWPPEGSRAYEAIVDGQPMLADDADVALIAAHVTRFALDILSSPGRSKFPSSLYAVGLSAEWAFSAPYETFAIPVEGTGGWDAAGQTESVDNFKAAIEILSSVLPKKAADTNEPPAAP